MDYHVVTLLLSPIPSNEPAYHYTSHPDNATGISPDPRLPEQRLGNSGNAAVSILKLKSPIVLIKKRSTFVITNGARSIPFTSLRFFLASPFPWATIPATA